MAEKPAHKQAEKSVDKQAEKPESPVALSVNNFWNKSFKDTAVPVANFVEAFVKRYQNGQDGYPKYPAEVLFTIVHHFIARSTGLEEVKEITTRDMGLFVSRFGAMDTAVDTVAENYLDPDGKVHMWYLFHMTDDRVKARMRNRGVSCFCVTDTLTGNLTVHLLRTEDNSGYHSVSIERARDESGKIVYGVKDGHGQFQAFKHGILDYLEKEADKRIALQSELWLSLHHDQKSASTTSGDGGGAATAVSLSVNVKPVWACYSNKDKKITTSSYADWSGQRDKQREIVGNRYHQAFAIMTTTAPDHFDKPSNMIVFNSAGPVTAAGTR